MSHNYKGLSSLWLLTMVLMVVAFAPVARALSDGVDVEFGGSGSDPGKFADLRDLTFGKDNSLYTLEGPATTKDRDHTWVGNNRVQKFDNAGKFISQFPIVDPVIGDKSDPQRIAVDDMGNVFITQPTFNVVEQFGPDGKLVRDIPVNAAMGISVWNYQDKQHIAVIGFQNRIVQGHWAKIGGSEIDILNSDGTTEPSIALDRTLSNVADLAADSAGDFYMVADSHQLYEFGPTGKLIRSVGAASNTRVEDGSELLHTVAVDSKGNVYTMAWGTITEFDPKFTTVTQHQGKFHWFEGWNLTGSYFPLAVDHSDRLWGAAVALVTHPLFERFHYRPAILRTDTRFLDPTQHGVSQHSTLTLGFKPSVVSTLPYNTAYDHDLAMFPLDLVVAPANRQVNHVAVSYRVQDVFGAEVAKGQFEMDLKDGAEARQPFSFKPPRLGWYAVSCVITAQNTQLAAIETNVGVTPRYAAVPALAAGEAVGGWEDAPLQAFSGLPIMRLHAGKGLDKLEKDVAAAQKYGVTYFVQLSDKKDCTPEAVTAAVTRMKGKVPVWEIMNEPNFSMSPADYVALVKTLYPLIKGIDPNAKVMGPDVCGIQLGWYQQFYKLGGKDYVDILSIHDYEGHESIDPVHWIWKLGELRKLMAQYGDENKPIWQTERAITGVRGGVFMPAAQAVRVLMHRNLLETLGIPPNHNNLYYLQDAGYATVPSYVWSASGPHPAVYALRTRQAMTAGLIYAGKVDFGVTGNRLFLGLRYTGADGSVVEMSNLGTLDRPMDFTVKGGPTVTLVDAFGNQSQLPVKGGKVTVTLTQLPIYLQLSKGQTLTAPSIDFGTNIAPLATFTYTGETKSDMHLLNNGIMETIHAGDPNGGTDGKKIWQGDFTGAPQTLEITFPTPQTIDRMLVFTLRADNNFCTVLDYDLEYLDGATWKTLDKVRTEFPPTDQVSTTACLATAWLQDNNFVIHHFKPVTTSKLRIVVLRTTWGFAADKTASDAVFKTWGGTNEPKVMFREIEIYPPRR